MKVVIAGGTGHVGRILSRHFHPNNEVVVLSRRPGSSPWRTVIWDGRTQGEWTSEVDGADVVINLAGRSVNCRYNARNRDEILRSRVDSTRAVGEAVARAKHPPSVWLQASTATIYAHMLPGRDNLAAEAWEKFQNENREPKPAAKGIVQ